MSFWEIVAGVGAAGIAYDQSKNLRRDIGGVIRQAAAPSGRGFRKRRKLSQHGPAQTGHPGARPTISLSRTLPVLPAPRQGYRPKPAVPVPMQVVPIQPPAAIPALNINMPGRRRRRVRFGRKRKRRSSTVRRRRKSAFKRRRRSKRRGSRHRNIVRLYPGGLPLSHIVKLRVLTQCQFESVGGQWCVFRFRPADMLIPFGNQATAANSTNTGDNPRPYVGVSSGAWFDKTGTTVAERKKQPQGYDSWLDQSASLSAYKKYIVLGSKISITTIDGNVDSGANVKLYAGFTKLYDRIGGITLQSGVSIGDNYSNIIGTEVADWLSVRMVKNLGIVQSNPLANTMRASRTFTYNYSQKKYKRHMKRIGLTNDDDWFGSHLASPLTSPEVFFCLADLGASSADTKIPCVVNIEYTVRLSGLEVPDRSVGA